MIGLLVNEGLPNRLVFRCTPASRPGLCPIRSVEGPQPRSELLFIHPHNAMGATGIAIAGRTFVWKCSIASSERRAWNTGLEIFSSHHWTGWLSYAPTASLFAVPSRPVCDLYRAF